MTGISWTDQTWNPVAGCAVLSPGCKHCYAMRLAGGRLKNHPKYKGLTEPSKAGPIWTGEIRRAGAEELEAPLHWGKPRQIFVCSMGDLFHENTPRDAIDEVVIMATRCRRHLFQILTKRPSLMRDYFLDLGQELDRIAYEVDRYEWPLENVWLGFSAEDQERFDLRLRQVIPLAARGWKVFVSLEPLLGPIDAAEGLSSDAGGPWIKHVIAGGESGPRARPSHPDWFRSLRAQCGAAGVPFHFKQWGEFWYGRIECHPDKIKVIDWPSGDHPGKPDLMRCHDLKNGWLAEFVGRERAGRTLDGQIHDAQMKG